MPFHDDDGTAFFRMARAVIQEANFACTVHIEEPDRIISHYDRVSHLLQIIVQLTDAINENEMDNWVGTINRTRERITQHLEAIQEFDFEMAENDATIPHALQVAISSVPTGGRPRFHIPWDVVTLYRNLQYSWTTVASFLNIHPKTLHRHRIAENYRDPTPFSNITDIALDDLVSQFIDQFNGVVGSGFMSAILKDHGIKVQRNRVRESMRRVDQLGNLERWAALVPRLKYSVRGPNCLWHMDGNLKLKDYGFVLHGCIDGYSRRIIYLEVNTNNCASTVLNAFLTGIRRLNMVPERIRADKGRENVDVATWMLVNRGVDRGSFITGRSVHNQRIERLW